ncbi:hypothetical protein BGZ73_007904 [Actinomortierella ambigua]|nr:hypothetical protein BGZ73_007904 [Actinomortierella ambigua]
MLTNKILLASAAVLIAISLNPNCGGVVSSMDLHHLHRRYQVNQGVAEDKHLIQQESFATTKDLKEANKPRAIAKEQKPSAESPREEGEEDTSTTSDNPKEANKSGVSKKEQKPSSRPARVNEEDNSATSVRPKGTHKSGVSTEEPKPSIASPQKTEEEAETRVKGDAGKDEAADNGRGTRVKEINRNEAETHERVKQVPSHQQPSGPERRPPGTNVNSEGTEVKNEEPNPGEKDLDSSNQVGSPSRADDGTMKSEVGDRVRESSPTEQTHYEPPKGLGYEDNSIAENSTQVPPLATASGSSRNELTQPTVSAQGAVPSLDGFGAPTPTDTSELPTNITATGTGFATATATLAVTTTTIATTTYTVEQLTPTSTPPVTTPTFEVVNIAVSIHAQKVVTGLAAVAIVAFFF